VSVGEEIVELGGEFSGDDEALRRIMFVSQVRRAGDGELLACSICGRTVSYTYRTVCGACYLAGKAGEAS
jgi:hypothetical protein